MEDTDETTTWKKLLQFALEGNGETMHDIISNTMTEAGSEGIPFTIWTKGHVYFPAVYDGSEWVASVPRNPNNEPTQHIGGQ